MAWVPCLTTLLAYVPAAPAQAAAFDCRQAANPTEKAICADPRLNALDEQLNKSHVELTLRMEAAGNYTRALQYLEDSRQAWRKERDACGADTFCIAGAYHQRLAEVSYCFRSDAKGQVVSGTAQGPAPECPALHHAYRYATASQCAYQTDVTQYRQSCTGDPDWAVVDPRSIGIPTERFHDEKSGFDALLLKDRQSGEHLLAFRGSDESKDWLNGNIPQELGLDGGAIKKWLEDQVAFIRAGHRVPGTAPLALSLDYLRKELADQDQYTQAKTLADAIDRSPKLEGTAVHSTGHSLGGGLATAAALRLGQPAIVFNPAGLHPATAQRLDLPYSNAGRLVDIYAIEGDVLTSSERNGPLQKAPGKWHGLMPPHLFLQFPNAVGMVTNHRIETVLASLRELIQRFCA